MSDWMSRALEMAVLAKQHKEVPVGCVVVRKDSMVAKGCNEVNASMNATRHAEMVAIDQLVILCRSNRFKLEEFCSECTLYVTVEPCVMCSFSLRICNLTEIVYGCHNERFGGCGSVLNLHTDSLGIPLEMVEWSLPNKDMDLPKLSVTSRVMEDKAILLLQEFYESENPSAPEQKRKQKTKKCEAMKKGVEELK